MSPDALRVSGTFTVVAANGRTVALAIPGLFLLPDVLENGKPVYQERTGAVLKTRLAYDGTKWVLTAYAPGTRSAATDHFWHSAATATNLPETANWSTSAQSPATGVPSTLGLTS